MVNPASSSLLAAQLYTHAAQGGGAELRSRPAPPPQSDRTSEARSFPSDKVELGNDVRATAESRHTQETSSRFDAEEQARDQAHADDDARAFAREAPGTGGQRNLPPGSHFDLRV